MRTFYQDMHNNDLLDDWRSLRQQLEAIMREADRRGLVLPEEHAALWQDEGGEA